MGDRRSNMSDIREAESVQESGAAQQRMRRRSGRIALAVIVVGALIFLFRPTIVALSDDEVTSFAPPIETRTDRDFYLKVFQKRDGRWYQCKTWISRHWFH